MFLIFSFYITIINKLLLDSVIFFFFLMNKVGEKKMRDLSLFFYGIYIKSELFK
jgi:hypothetical protein